VRWSSRHALADTLANFRRHRVALLPPKRDVDSAEDLAATGRRMFSRRNHPYPGP